MKLFWGILTLAAALAAATAAAAVEPGSAPIYVSRHYTYPSAFLERMTLRTDGFVSVHAGYGGGTLTSKPLLIEGNQLVLNYATSAAGSIRWEIQDLNGHSLPGYGLEETKILSGDQIERVIQIQNPKHKPARGLESKPVRLHFIMKDADLYSLQVRN